MPVVSVDAQRLNTMLGMSLPPDELGQALDRIGCDVEDVVDLQRYRCPSCSAKIEGSLGVDEVKLCNVCGHSQETPFEQLDSVTVIRLDLLAARPDLFDIGGLSRALKGTLDVQRGLPRYDDNPDSGLVVHVNRSVKEVDSFRPHIRCAVVRIPALDDDTLTLLMKAQESLHWGVGRDRKLASIGVYDLDTVTGPIHYTTMAPTDGFEPLGMPGREMTGAQILAEHPKGTAYANLLEGYTGYPVLKDSQGQVLSMPPIINSESTKVKAGSTNLFIDVTGPSLAAVQGTLRVLASSMIELGGQVQTVTVIDGEHTHTSPVLTPGSERVTLSGAKRWLGLPLDAASLTDCFERMRLDVVPLDEQGEAFEIRYPAFRSDIRHVVDLFEDLAIGFGYHNIVPLMVPSMTVSTPRPEAVISGRARGAMFGLGYTEVMSLPLTSEEEHFTRLRLPVPEQYPRIANPKLKALTVVRTHLISGVMSALNANRRRAMPLRLFEMDDVVNLDAQGINGTRDERRLCFADIGPEAGFADARATLDAVLFELGLEGSYQATEHPSFVPGRVARFTAGGVTALIGEIHPEVLVNFGLEYPVALVEVVLADIRP